MIDNNQSSIKTERNAETDQRVKSLLKECENLSSPQPKIAPSVLQEVYQNAMLGKYAVENLRPLSSDRGFRNLLLKQYKEYSAIAKEIEVYADKVGMDVKSINIFSRGMMYFTTMMNTIGNKSNSKLAEIMIQGINMGIISLTKIINKKSDEEESHSFAKKMMEVLDKNLEEMKLFL